MLSRTTSFTFACSCTDLLDILFLDGSALALYAPARFQRSQRDKFDMSLRILLTITHLMFRVTVIQLDKFTRAIYSRLHEILLA